MKTVKLTIPFKDATPARITQGFHEKHKGIDIISLMPDTTLGSGIPLVAPENVQILRIIGDGYSLTEKEALQSRAHGWGVFMKGLETGKISLYWHCQPYFPVEEGQTVQRGKIVAFMGNSGTVYSKGTYVPVTERYTHKGTHLHQELIDKLNNGVKRGFNDPQEYIDWDSKTTYTLFEELTAWSIVLLKKLNILKKGKIFIK